MKVIEGAVGAIEDRARDMRDRLRADAQYRYLQKVMAWEGVDYGTAIDICTGKSPERHPEHILGYRLSDPVMLEALYLSPTRKSRAKAAEVFKETLDPDCLELFETNYNRLGKAFKKENKERRSR